MKIRVSDYIAQYLENRGVTHVFWLSGGGMMHLMDAVARREKLKYVSHHHEQSCAFAAEAYARQRQDLGVCYATSGPGGANTVTGVVTAYQDSSPVLFLTGQAKVSETIRGRKLQGLRQFGTFEVDIVPIVQSITKYAVFLEDPKSVRYHLEKAIALALSGRPGPVLIDVPVDVQGALVDPDELVGYNETPFEEKDVSESVMNEVLDAFKNAKRPMILAGHGIRCAKSVDQFLRVLQSLNVPTATSQLGKDVFHYEHDLFVGHPGVKGDRPGGLIVQSADLILTLGCSLHSMTTGYELDQFAPQARKIQVDLDEMVLKREGVGVHQKIQASVQTFLTRMEACLEKRLEKGQKWVETGSWHERCRIWKRELAVHREPHKHPNGELNYYDVIDSLSDLAQGGETIVADAGSAFYITGQAFRAKKGQRFILCGALAQMGYTTSAVIGASVAAPQQTVIGITGDGSLQTNIHDFAVFKHHQLNIKMIVVNNRGYVSIRNTQNNYFNGLLAGTDTKSGLSFPDLGKLCDAYGLKYLYADNAKSMKEVLQEALSTPGPVVCEIMTAYEQEIVPSVTSVRLENGKMQSKPLSDMYPFMTPEELNRYTHFE
jgi:acetolactate synthase-1/2/3 large subunit